jgi:DNA-binding CsgD family transcriptional regulator/tetratricopeptide (TPR) repeat protein
MVVGPVVCPSLIGRADELRELVDRRLAAARGRGGLVLVSGEAGIGKSRLMRAFRATLTGGRAQFGIGYCSEVGNAPYAPLNEALSGLGATAQLAPARSKEEQLAALSDAVARSCERRNAVLILEDLHWADSGTLGALVHLLSALERLRLLVVATYRSDEVHQGHLASPYLARLKRFSTTVNLQPLSNEEMRRLLRGALGSRNGLSAHDLQEIVDRSEGNPFFAEELLKNVLERRGERIEMHSLPLTIRASVLERLSGLDAATLAVARCSAILGKSFSLPLLCALCEVDGDSVLAALRRLRDLQRVEELGDASDRFMFRHSMTRDVIYESMLLQEVRPVHERALHILETSCDAPAYDLGYHALMARDAERCIRYNESAGDDAQAVHAYTDALRSYQRALELAIDPKCCSRLLAKAAAACACDGHSRKAIEFYASAISRSEAAGDKDRVAALRIAMASQARLAGQNERACSILTKALEESRRSETFERDEIALNLALCKLDVAETAEAQALIAECAKAARTPLYWNVARYAAAIAGDLPGARAAHARFMQCVFDDPVSTLRGRFNYGFLHCALGADGEALEIFDAILPDLKALRLSSLEVLTCANAALVQARRGNITAACDLVERALAVPETSTTAPVACAAAALASGDEELIARAVSEEILDAALKSGIDSTLGRLAGPYARLLRDRGEAREARALLTKTLQLLHGPFAATETMIAAAELDEDGSFARPLEKLVRQAEAMRQIPLYAATVAHVRAISESRNGDASAGSAFEAARRYLELGWPAHASACSELAAGARRVRQRIHVDHEWTALSPRETAIAKLVVAGTSNAAMAERLAVSRRTVEKHLTSIYTKLRVRNRAQLVAFVTRQGTTRDRT